MFRYDRDTRKAHSRASLFVWEQLKEDWQYALEDVQKGVPWPLVRQKMIIRMWLTDVGHFTFWGGTKVVGSDKQNNTTKQDKLWIEKIRKTHEQVAEKTNRKLFSRWYIRKKVAYPTSFAFFENGTKSKGRHIHTLHHFPAATIKKANDYMFLFEKNWNDHQVNRSVGRTFWHQPVENQDKAIRYATKKMTYDNEDGWWAVG